MFISTLARFAAGPVLVKVRFKYFFAGLMVCALIMAASIMYAGKIWYIFCVYFSISLFLRGASSVSQPIFFAQTFGAEVAAQAFSVFFTAQSISPLILSGVIFAF